MKLNINIDAEAKEPEIMITTAQMTEEVNRVVDFVSRLDDAPTIISGIREDKVELLDPDHIVKIYAEDSKVFTQTDNGIICRNNYLDQVSLIRKNLLTSS